jgi:RNA polymerase sigma-70 factor, ECF subfamily
MSATQNKLNPPAAPVAEQLPEATSENGGAATSFSPVDWAALVAQIKAGDHAGMEQLYKLFSRGVRYYLCRQ